MNRMLPSEIFGPSVIWCKIENVICILHSLSRNLKGVSGFIVQRELPALFFLPLKGVFPTFVEKLTGGSPLLTKPPNR